MRRRWYTDAVTRSTGLLVVGLVIAAWFTLAPAYVSELRFPSPAATLRSINALGDTLLINSRATLVRVLTGWFIGCLGGVVVGLMMTRSPFVERSLNPLLEIARPLPPVALVPFFILWFGVGASGQIVLIALSCFMVLAVTTFSAARLVPTIYVQTAASLGASPARIYRTVVLPAIIPAIAAGCRVSAALAFGVGVAAEFMGAQSGLGYMMMVARRTLNTDTILVGLLALGVESFAFDSLLRIVTRRITRWADSPMSETIAAI
ncbi:MAG: ABC transporter permease [Acidobacteriota bacterium]|nr:ABC transporter permease [Acidobacteriota bacterium]